MTDREASTSRATFGRICRTLCSASCIGAGGRLSEGMKDLLHLTSANSKTRWLELAPREKHRFIEPIMLTVICLLPAGGLLFRNLRSDVEAQLQGSAGGDLGERVDDLVVCLLAFPLIAVETVLLLGRLS